MAKLELTSSTSGRAGGAGVPGIVIVHEYF